MTRTFHEELPRLVADAYDSMVGIRHDLHAHPELSFQETRTTGVIVSRLRALGIAPVRCPTPTGAVGVLRGARPGRRVMLRADIDALPITEERPLPYASVNEGVMHACGHDVHTAALLGIADVLSARRDELAGEFIFVFQPAEEGLGGARAMIEGGLLDEHPADVVIGAHVTSLGPVGLVATRPGILMSEAVGITIRIEGKGGHGAMASAEGSVVLALSSLAPRLDEVVAGMSTEGTNCACSAGVLQAGTASNVVPSHALLKGTLRTFTPDQQRDALNVLRRILVDTERTYSVRCSLETSEGTPAVVNNPDVARRVIGVAGSIVGADHVVNLPPASPSDDVSEFLNRIPGCYLFVGGALADGTSGMHHSPDFAVDDEACRSIATVLSACAVDLARH